VVKDLISYNVLIKGDDGKLIEKPGKNSNGAPDIFKVLNEQSEAFIRWEVEAPDDRCSKVWEDKALWQSWINYYSNIYELSRKTSK